MNSSLVSEQIISTSLSLIHLVNKIASAVEQGQISAGIFSISQKHLIHWMKSYYLLNYNIMAQLWLLHKS